MGTETIRLLAGAALAVSLAGGLAACNRQGADAPEPAPAPPLLARADLFGEPARENAQLSPLGDRVAFISVRDGAPNVFVVSVAAMDQPRPVTDDQDLGVRDFRWAYDNATILYLQDPRGDGNERLFAAPAAGGEVRALTPENVRAQVIGLSPVQPGDVIVTLNQRDAAWPDVYRINIASGERTLIYRNGGPARGFTSFVTDRENNLRLGLRPRADGGSEVFARQPDGSWASLLVIPFEDAMASRPIAFEADGRSFLMLDSTGRDRAALVRVDAMSGVKTVLGESQRADVVDVWLSPNTGAAEAFAADYLRPEWRALDADAQADLDFFESQLDGRVTVVSRSADDQRWIVVEDSPTIPTRSYLYDRSDRANRRLTMLFRNRPALESAPLQPMTPVEIEARDGLTLVSYLTLPAGSDANGDARPETPQPLIIAPRSDAWGRDSYGFNSLHQWLANRGYAVLSVNFRGSSGFGKAFQNAGFHEWGGRMQEDLLDAVQWAIDNQIARADHVAIVGAGYGGYAALSGLAFTPETYRCGVALSPPASLASMIEATPAYAPSLRDGLYLRVGDLRSPDGRVLLRDRSPINRVREMRSPLLLATGGRTPATLRSDADQIARGLTSRRVPVIYLNYPNEGAQLLRVQSRLSFYAVAEQFLSECLGGRAEPVGAAFEGVSLQALEGAARVPGLSAFERPRVQAAPVQPAAAGEETSVDIEPALSASEELEPPTLRELSPTP
ncbi:MAG: prolyl oligopeptidase family serine peptidase [Hyphomonadaceae bacterium]|nr:prolyl oligopeptidase family serine peptidase [Hyphomonadaceae bacterium]